MVDGAAAAGGLPPLGVGDVGGVALFALAIGIMLWPMARRRVDAHRKHVLEASIAAGGQDRK